MRLKRQMTLAVIFSVQRRAAFGAVMFATLSWPTVTTAQVDLHPSTIKPASWERFALRVANQTDTAYTTVRLTVPEAIMVLGVQPMTEWTSRLEASTDSTPQSIEWTGGSVMRGDFMEFVFLGRLPPDVRRNSLIFPVQIVRASGSLVEWNRRSDTGIPPTVQIVGTTSVTAWGSMALAGIAVGIAVIALALVIAGRRNAV